MSAIHKPQAILFDYGHTLVYEEYFNITKGGEALYDCIIRNGSCATRDEFVEFSNKIYEGMSRSRRELALEVPASSFTRVLREYFDIEFAVDETGVQKLFWDAISPPNPMSGADDMLIYLSTHDIKTAVISNLWYEEPVLKERIERLLPHANFEFYMTTCDYGFRKPEKILFDIALKRIGTDRDRTWFCGDEPMADIEGAYRAGLMPVWFDADIICPYKFKKQENPQSKTLRIRNWSELAEFIDRC